MKNGNYILIKAPVYYPGKRYREKYVYEHHYVYWLNTGYIISSNEVIHHKNENKIDNRFENLELKTSKQHSLDHAKKVIIKTKCKNCLKNLFLKGNDYRRRIKNTMGIFCNRSCATKYQFNKF